jgi:hypothetical protein
MEVPAAEEILVETKEIEVIKAGICKGDQADLAGKVVQAGQACTAGLSHSTITIKSRHTIITTTDMEDMGDIIADMATGMMIIMCLEH